MALVCPHAPVSAVQPVGTCGACGSSRRQDPMTRPNPGEDRSSRAVRDDAFSEREFLCHRRWWAVRRFSDAYAVSGEMNRHDPLWPCGKVHIRPVGKCTCAHAPSLATYSSTDALCISELSAQRGVATVLMLVCPRVPMIQPPRSFRARRDEPNSVCSDSTVSGSSGEG